MIKVKISCLEAGDPLQVMRSLRAMRAGCIFRVHASCCDATVYLPQLSEGPLVTGLGTPDATAQDLTHRELGDERSLLPYRLLNCEKN